VAWTTPRTWVAGELVTAALLNTHLRDNLNAVTTWTTWSPTLTNLSIGNGTQAGRYISAGGFVQVEYSLQWGSTTSASGALAISLPVTAAALTGTPFRVTGDARDASAGENYTVRGRLGSTTSLTLITGEGASAAGIGTASPFTWATSDELHFWGRYRTV
jgi:hypothetical protein